MKNLVDNRDLDNLRKIVENDKAIGKKNNGIKILVYTLFICIINKYRKCNGKTVYVINGKAELKFSQQKDAMPIYYAVVSNKIGDYRKLLTHASYSNRKLRMKILIYSVVKREKDIPIGYLLDYLLWKAFFISYTAESIGGSGHYDRLTTQLAFLANKYNKKFYMKQHGMLGYNTNLPHKIPIDRVVAFDNMEIEKFKKEIVLNNDCIFTTEYISTVNFKYTQKDKKSVGIIDTPIDEMMKLIQIVLEQNYDCEYTIMLHPLSKIPLNKSEYKSMKFIKEPRKELNYDVIFSGPSTLVYDYLKAGYDKPIIVYDLDGISGLCDVAKSYENVKLCYSLLEFQEACKNLEV